MITKSIVCPSCDARLKLAGTPPAGKKIKCPKCGDAFVPPDEEDDEPVEAVAVEPTRKRKAAPPPDDDDEDEVEERPRRRPRRKAEVKQRSNAALFVGLGLGAVVLVTAGVVGFLIWSSKSKNTQVAQTPTPAPTQTKPSPQGQPVTPDANAMAAATTPPAGGNAGNPGNAPTTSGGRKVFNDHNCGRCHSLDGGQGGGRGKRGNGPDLSFVGAKQDAQWIIEHIRNPKSHRPNSRMPAYEGKIPPQDLQALGDFLASLK